MKYILIPEVMDVLITNMLKRHDANVLFIILIIIAASSSARASAIQLYKDLTEQADVVCIAKVENVEYATMATQGFMVMMNGHLEPRITGQYKIRVNYAIKGEIATNTILLYDSDLDIDELFYNKTYILSLKRNTNGSYLPYGYNYFREIPESIDVADIASDKLPALYEKVVRTGIESVDSLNRDAQMISATDCEGMLGVEKCKPLLLSYSKNSDETIQGAALIALMLMCKSDIMHEVNEDVMAYISKQHSTANGHYYSSVLGSYISGIVEEGRLGLCGEAQHDSTVQMSEDEYLPFYRGLFKKSRRNFSALLIIADRGTGDDVHSLVECVMDDTLSGASMSNCLRGIERISDTKMSEWGEKDPKLYYDNEKTRQRVKEWWEKEGSKKYPGN